MAMGKRKQDRQPSMWVATTDVPRAASHSFYTRLNQLPRASFDDFRDAQCATFYAETMGRLGLFLGVGLEDPRPDHSTISRTRGLIDLEAHRATRRGCRRDR